MYWAEIVEEELVGIDEAGQRRAPRDLALTGPRGSIRSTNAKIVSFASNDYLGLATHRAVTQAAATAACELGAGSGSARLIVGSRALHSDLEAELADWRGTDSATLFPTGFAANLGAMTTFGAHASVICSDELNHASIIDGCRQARAPVKIFDHRNVARVDAILAESGDSGIVVSDSIFSMDGDLAPIAELASVCAAHSALLILDDAHAVFELPELNSTGAEILRIGTLSKMLGSLGGFVAGPKPFCDLLVNRARSYIFTTASTPPDMAAATAALAVVRSPEGAALTATLRGHIDRFRPGHPSPILPIVIGSETAAVAASAELESRGLLVPAIRPPTVAPGTSRLRVTLSAAHTNDEVEQLAAALEEMSIDPS
ncbi:MAG: aminotransferase class I/II-fold pyridoxal phosphate-dependent enzyme [Acidobacteria bacterium]|nr:aminotransferase class I/II-fold pyridoxal phosphate-dependent enzyme [Acidobacteriota bacterium]